MELIVCVSTAEALKAAVLAGADAVRIGLRDLSTAGLPLEELKKTPSAWGTRACSGPCGCCFRI